MTEQKKIPRAVQTVLGLIGYILGIATIFITISIGLGINHFYESLLASALIMVVGLIVLQLIQWRYHEALEEWDILKPKKKKGKKKQ